MTDLATDNINCHLQKLATTFATDINDDNTSSR